VQGSDTKKKKKGKASRKKVLIAQMKRQYATLQAQAEVQKQQLLLQLLTKEPSHFFESSPV